MRVVPLVTVLLAIPCYGTGTKQPHAFALDAYETAPSSDEASLVTPSGERCRALVVLEPEPSADALRALADQLRVCGFVYLAPGSAVDKDWVSATHASVAAFWDGFKRDNALARRYATPIPAGGKRVDIVMPQQRGPRSPFNASLFGAFAPALFRLFDASLADCCSLQMMVVKNALKYTATGNPDVDGHEQTWHDDSLPGLFDEQIGVAVALHDMTTGLIAVQPGCFPPVGFHHRLAAADAAPPAADAPPCYATPGYVPARVAAGTVLVHRARLRHRGLWNYGPNATRFMLQLNVAPSHGWQEVFAEKTAHGRGEWAEIHGAHRAAFARRLAEVRELCADT